MVAFAHVVVFAYLTLCVPPAIELGEFEASASAFSCGDPVSGETPNIGLRAAVVSP